MDTFKTPYGTIHHAEHCKDDYENLDHYNNGGSGVVILQAPALRSFKESEEALFRIMHPVKARTRKRKNRPPGREPIVVLGGSKRTCELQRQLWESDPERFAHPDVGLHPHGLAIDVSQAQGRRKLKLVYRVLMARGWHKSRPVDEPWHLSYHLTA